MPATLAGLAQKRKRPVSFVSVPRPKDRRGGVRYRRVTGRLNIA